jgi:S1-C subfamily serine protease
MNSSTRTILLAVFLAAGVAAGLGLGRALDSRSEAATTVLPAKPEPPPALLSLQDSFSKAADFAMQSVVHITTQGGGSTDLFSPQGVGSGVIVSDKGHILTNNHVTELAGERARALRVRFANGRELPARIVGTDSESDLALLKIEPKDLKLVPITFADSDQVRVGDWCLAIGSPFGYNHTVTAGIVSAKHRRAQMMTPYQDFLQTDAAINPGNSGGALVNLSGELIGINTAIVSESHGNEGLGFAIASNLVRWVKDRLLSDGRVRRGFLGIQPLDFDGQLVNSVREKYDGIRSMEDLLEALKMKEPRGVYLYSVEADTPAAKAGLKDNDVLFEFNGKPIGGQTDLFFRVAEVSPGTQVAVKVLREGKEREFKVELSERDPRQMLPSRRKR